MNFVYLRKKFVEYVGMLIGLCFFCVALLPMLCLDIYRGLLTGLRLGRLDFENDLVRRKEEVQLELFRRSCCRNNEPKEVVDGIFSD